MNTLGGTLGTVLRGADFTVDNENLIGRTLAVAREDHDQGCENEQYDHTGKQQNRRVDSNHGSCGQ